MPEREAERASYPEHACWCTEAPARLRPSGPDQHLQALPASAHLLKSQMEATLLKYEPRICAIDVEILENDDPGVLVSFEMACHLKKAGLVGTYFEPPDRMWVERRQQAKSGG